MPKMLSMLVLASFILPQIYFCFVRVESIGNQFLNQFEAALF